MHPTIINPPNKTILMVDINVAGHIPQTLCQVPQNSVSTTNQEPFPFTVSLHSFIQVYQMIPLPV